MLARMLQALPAPPAALVLFVPPATILPRVERLADDQLRRRRGKTVMGRQYRLKRVPET